MRRPCDSCGELMEEGNDTADFCDACGQREERDTIRAVYEFQKRSELDQDAELAALRSSSLTSEDAQTILDWQVIARGGSGYMLREKLRLIASTKGTPE